MQEVLASGRRISDLQNELRLAQSDSFRIRDLEHQLEHSRRDALHSSQAAEVHVKRIALRAGGFECGVALYHQ